MKGPKKSISQIDARARYRLAIRVLFKVMESGQRQLISEEALEAATIDISAGGLKFQCDLPLQVGDVLGLQLCFPSEEIIVIGKVVRTESFTEAGESTQERNAVALEFIELPSDRKKRIRELITPKLSLKLEEPEEEESKEEPAPPDGFPPPKPEA